MHGDVLDIHDLPELLASFSKKAGKNGSKLKVVANIPYNITSSALLTTLFSGHACIVFSCMTDASETHCSVYMQVF